MEDTTIYNAMIESYINGNITWFKESIRKCTTIEILRISDLAVNQYGIDREEITKVINSALI